MEATRFCHRTRALACAGRGSADAAALRALRERGAELGRHAALPELDEALASAFR